MKKVNVVELFYSIQGEGVYVGVPTVFLRLAGCNFRCNGFGCKVPWSPQPDEVEPFQNVLRLRDFKVPTYGCDTIYAVDPKYKHLWTPMTVNQVKDSIFNLINKEVSTSDGRMTTFNQNSIHLVITGGEPFLHQEFMAELLEKLHDLNLNNVTIETNGSLQIEDYLLAQLSQYETLLSISPKLYNCSGIDNSKAIKYDTLTEYYFSGLDTCLKFVLSDEENAWSEMESIVLKLKQVGCNFDVRIMPVGSSYEEYMQMSKIVAGRCMQRGYKFSPRLHINLFKNEVGT